MRTRHIGLTLLSALVFLLPPVPAHAVSKEIIQLQTQVQQLQDALSRLQSSNDEKLGVLQHLVEQTADSVNKMSAAVAALQQKSQAQNDAASAKIDGISGQIQSLNDSVDELKSRIAKVDKQLQDMQAQMQSAQAALAANAAPAPGGTAPAGQDSTQPAGAPPVQAPPLQQLYQSGLRDYNSAKYELALSEFGDVLKYYPHDDLAGNAQFYIAEVAYRQGKYHDAIKGYDAVLEQFAGNPKAPAAQLRKGESLMNLNQREAGARELRSLIQRYPQTPEAQQARTRLNAMGVRISPKPSPATP